MCGYLRCGRIESAERMSLVAGELLERNVIRFCLLLLGSEAEDVLALARRRGYRWL